MMLLRSFPLSEFFPPSSVDVNGHATISVKSFAVQENTCVNLVNLSLLKISRRKTVDLLMCQAFHVLRAVFGQAGKSLVFKYFLLRGFVEFLVNFSDRF
jgi:hypothetical protein